MSQPTDPVLMLVWLLCTYGLVSAVDDGVQWWRTRARRRLLKFMRLTYTEPLYWKPMALDYECEVPSARERDEIYEMVLDTCGPYATGGQVNEEMSLQVRGYFRQEQERWRSMMAEA